MEVKYKRWRLIMGEAVDEKINGFAGVSVLNEEDAIMDQALAAIYDDTTVAGEGGNKSPSGKRGAGGGKSAPNLAKWLGDIRSFFPPDVVSVIQADAIEKKGLTQLFFEPETLANIKPDIAMVGTLMALKGQIPEKTKDTARLLVKSVVDEIMKRLENDLRRAVTGALNKSGHSPIPSLPGTDWKLTIKKNLENYDAKRKKIIPKKFYFYERKRKYKEWTVIVDMDQSGSMCDSIIYSSVMSSVFASMPSLDTRVVAFDTNVVDFTETCGNDPVDIIFGVQLGGGTDINKSVQYCQSFITEPKKTLFLLISDLYEGGVEAGLLKNLEDMRDTGVKIIALLALSDRGIPAYNEKLAKKINSMGIPAFGCTPDRLPELIEGALKGKDLMVLSSGLKL